MRKLPVDIYDEKFLRTLFAFSDERSLPETPPNYPPFVSWDKKDGIAPQKVVKLWKKSNKINAGRIPTIYVHIPFCQYICRFCGFYKKIPSGRTEMEKYLISLKKEALYFKEAFSGIPIRNLCFGGGTPTILSKKQLEFLLGIFRENFTLTGQTRIAMEASPHTITYEKAKKLVGLGVNYLSIGIQSFNEKLMRSLNRPQTEKQAREALLNARKAGIENLQADLVVGLPGQTKEIFMKDIDILSEFDLERIYIFDLQPREFTSCFSSKKSSLNSHHIEIARGWRKEAFEKLIRMKGYMMSCGHWIYRNKGEEWPYTYDQQEEEGYSILGLGATSITYCADAQRYQNVSSVSKYCELISESLLPVDTHIVLSKKDEAVNYAVIKLMHTGQLIIPHFKAKFNCLPEEILGYEIKRLLKAGIIFKSSKSYILADRSDGIFFLRAYLYDAKVIEKMSKIAGIRQGDGLSCEKKDEIRDRKKICLMKKGMSSENPDIACENSQDRDWRDIYKELSFKRKAGMSEIILADCEPFSFEKAYKVSSIASAIGYEKIFLMSPFIAEINRKRLDKLLENKVAGFYFLTCAKENRITPNPDTMAFLSNAKLKLSAVCPLESLKDFQKTADILKENISRGFNETLFILRFSENKKEAYLLYKILKKFSSKIAEASLSLKHKVSILNSLPCLLYPNDKILFESFVSAGDARESQGSIVKLEVCLTCRYLLECPGPNINYLKYLPKKRFIANTNFYNSRDERYFYIKPVQK